MRIRETCEARALRLGISPPRLLAVTKSATPDEVRALVSDFGQAGIAENRTSLFLERYEMFSDDERPEMHLIGSLQTNKVKYIAGKCALIHSLDSLRLAAEIEKQSIKRGISTRVLIEINSGREEAKGGVLPELAEAFAEQVKLALHVPAVSVADAQRPVHRVAVLGGSGSDDVAAAHAAGADPYVSGNLKYNQMVDAPDEGINLIEAGHFYTEQPICYHLADMLRELDDEIETRVTWSCRIRTI